MDGAERVELVADVKGLTMSGPRPGSRIEGFDLARAPAFLGMVFVNFRVALATEEGSPRWLTWLDTRLDGRASATFVILAGVGLSLLSRRARETGDRAALAGVRRTLFRRAAFLFVVGLLYWPIWPADILHYYGVFLAVGAWLLNTPDQRLLGLAAVLILLFALLLVLGVDYNSGWDWRTLTYHGFWTPRGFVRNLIFNGFHPVVPWLAFLVLGMWLERRDLMRPEVCKNLVLIGLVVSGGDRTTGADPLRWSRRDRPGAPGGVGARARPPVRCVLRCLGRGLLRGGDRVLAILAEAVRPWAAGDGHAPIRPRVRGCRAGVET
jgi:hypothetical protein